MKGRNSTFLESKCGTLGDFVRRYLDTSILGLQPRQDDIKVAHKESWICCSLFVDFVDLRPDMFTLDRQQHLRWVPLLDLTSLPSFYLALTDLPDSAGILSSSS